MNVDSYYVGLTVAILLGLSVYGLVAFVAYYVGYKEGISARENNKHD